MQSPARSAPRQGRRPRPRRRARQARRDTVTPRIARAHRRKAEPPQERQRKQEGEAILPEGCRRRGKGKLHRQPLGDDVEKRKGNAGKHHPEGTDNGAGRLDGNGSLVFMSFIHKRDQHKSGRMRHGQERHGRSLPFARRRSFSSIRTYRRLRNRTGSADPSPAWAREKALAGLKPKPLPPVGSFTPP